MKCLSLMQPWATLVILGAKPFELRGWRTGHRGRLAIHASCTFPEAARQRCSSEPFRTLLHRAGFRSSADLPRGLILGTVDLVACVPAADVGDGLSLGELAVGDFTGGRWVWQFAAPVALANPRRHSGRLGLFDAPDLEDAPCRNT